MAKLVEMMMGRDYTLRTTKGHTIHFKKMTPKLVPKSIESEAMRFGAFPTDADEKAAEQSQDEADSQSTEPEEPRETRIRNAILQMNTDNVREEWTANGRPKTEALAKRAQVDDLHSQERDEIHDALKAEGALG